MDLSAGHRVGRMATRPVGPREKIGHGDTSEQVGLQVREVVVEDRVAAKRDATWTS